ncbi:hypothetical protein F2Q69_00019458 [Brassica cretica]|uniref:Uncharacterized protein n=1 Tax=Brassica cretica TaxID=69181 RepID=A0A8S9QAN4_BRACR|nr:hypothetical protein F2Q69_00019458 [Brassica cretica]
MKLIVGHHLQQRPVLDMITGKEIVEGESGDDVGRRHTAHGTKRNLIQTAQSLQTSLRCIDPVP